MFPIVRFSNDNKYLFAVAATVICQILCLSAAPASGHGNFGPSVRIERLGSAAVVEINGSGVLRVDRDLRGMDPYERASAFQHCFTRLGSENRVVARKIGRRIWEIETASGDPLMAVGRTDARSAGTTLDTLSTRWADRINSALSLPPIDLFGVTKPSFVPTGEAISMHVGGWAQSSQISVSAGDQRLLRSTFDPAGRWVKVHGLEPGRSSITVTATNDSGSSVGVSVEVIVENRAAQITPYSSAVVTGNPYATRGCVMQAVYNSVYNCVAARDGAHVELLDTPDVPQPLGAGKSISVQVSLRVIGEGLIPAQGTVAVAVRNQDDSAEDTPEALFYSNTPERISRAQTLFSASLPESTEPIRLVYHHINVDATALQVRVEVINQSPDTATIHMIHGIAGPIDDPVEAGHKAGVDFLQNLESDNGFDVTIAPRTRLWVVSRRVPEGQTVSGIIQMAQTRHVCDGVIVRVVADPPAICTDQVQAFRCLTRPANTDEGAFEHVPLTDDFEHSISLGYISDQIYRVPQISLTRSYQVGSPWQYIELGSKGAIARYSSAGDALEGNYGVLYTVNLTLENPTSDERTVVVDFDSDAGYAAAVFLVDGAKWIDMNALAPNGNRQVARVTLQAGQSKTLTIRTMPLSGSAYPASLVAHAA